MQVLYVAQQHDYGHPDAGHGFEYHNFYRSLGAMGLDVRVFDYPTLHREMGRRAMNRRLWDIVRADRPTLLFGVVRRDLLDTRVMRRISEDTDTTTVNWFCDDHWQFDTHARRWAPCFNWAVTTSQNALAKYQHLEGVRVIKSQWGCNPELYRPLGLEKRYDVTFVGQPYGRRRGMIEALQRAGIDVRCWGRGWPEGKLSQEGMVRVFNQSRVNLNFSAASSGGQSRLESAFRGRWVQATRDLPVLWRVWDRFNSAVAERNRHAADREEGLPRQIKGRVFEVPGCGGYLLTQPAENLADYYTQGEYIGVFEDADTLIDRVRHALANPDERERAARAAHEHTLAHHTWAHRFRDIFERVGVQTPAKQARRPAA